MNNSLIFSNQYLGWHQQPTFAYIVCLLPSYQGSDDQLLSTNLLSCFSALPVKNSYCGILDVEKLATSCLR